MYHYNFSCALFPDAPQFESGGRGPGDAGGSRGIRSEEREVCSIRRAVEADPKGDDWRRHLLFTLAELEAALGCVALAALRYQHMDRSLKD